MIDINVKELKKISHNQTTSERFSAFFMIGISITSFVFAFIFQNLEPMHYIMLFFNIVLLLVGSFLLYTTADAYYSDDFLVLRTLFFKKKVYFDEIIKIRESQRRQRIVINIKFKQENKTYNVSFFQIAQVNALEMIKQKLISIGNNSALEF